jgi:hypothetical protein
MSKKVQTLKHSALSILALLMLVLASANLVPFAGTSTALAASNVALGKTYTSSVAASSTYPDTNSVELTDGIYGPSNGSYLDPQWQGRSIFGSYTQTINLGSSYSLTEIMTNFLADCCGIGLPTSVSYAYSTDGTNFTNLGNAVAQPAVGKTTKFKFTLGTSVTAQYVRMTVNGTTWIFEDEMEVWANTGATNTPTNTSAVPTNTPTRTNTPTGPTNTPTSTPTRTNTPTGPTNTPTRTNTPTSGCGSGNLALGKSYTSSVAANASYPDTGGIELTNGVYGPSTYTDAKWQGRSDIGSYFQTVDLGQSCSVNQIFTNFLQDTAVAIIWPDTVSFAYSTDGTNFTSLGNATPQTPNGSFKKYQWSGTAVTARYIRMTVSDCCGWVFEDEMEVTGSGGPTATPTRTNTPTGPTATPGGNNTNVWQGSFFQPYLTDSWSATNFATEFQYMKDVKMDHVIWQWTVDSLPSRKWTYYPTTMAGFTQHNTYDAVGTSLAQAQAKGLKVWLGLNWTDDWWSHYANDNVWLTNEFTISKNAAQELWNRYGAQYGSTIAGFYLTMEMDNVNFPTQTTQDRMIAVYSDTANYIHATTGKPVMVAPFFNSSTGQNATTYASMWGYIVTNAALDVVAVQDGIGVGHATTANIGAWLSPLRNSIKAARPSTQFWSDLETMNPDFTPAAVSRVIDQLNAEKAYVDKFTTFSFNHYDSPQQGQTANYNAWKAYTDVH